MAIKNKIVAVRISEEEKLQLDLAAKDLDISNSSLLRSIIKIYLNNREEFDEKIIDSFREV